MASLEIDPRTAALLAIDLQKGVVAVNTEPRPSQIVVQNAVKLAAALRQRGGRVLLVRVAFAADGGDQLKPACDAPTAPFDRAPDFSEIVPELAPLADHVVTKRQWGAFYGTELDAILRRRQISTLVVCGISTAFGVESTARDAYERGYEQVFVEDAMASRASAEHEHVVTRIFPRIGRVRRTSEVLRALEATR